MAETKLSKVTRRRFLGSSVVVLAAPALSTSVRAQSATFRRWEISDANIPPRVLDSYKAGIRAMLALPPMDPRNWYRNAFVHVLDCPHGNWWFLVWHRAYLGWFEKTVRNLSGDAQFALPYWDWTKTPRIPAAMFDDVLNPGNSAFIASADDFRSKFDAPVGALWTALKPAQKAALAKRGLSTTANFWQEAQSAFAGGPTARGLTAGAPDFDATTQAAVRLSVITSALKAPTFSGTGSGSAAGFGSAKASNHSAGSRKGILESQPHDNVHGMIGGFMGAFLSPVDPIFFLHHGNLDRLWSVWTKRQSAANKPTLPQGADLTAWSNEQFLFFSDAGGQPVTKVKAGGYVDSAVFDYDYSPGSGEQVPVPPSAAPPAPSAALTAQVTSPTIAEGKPGEGKVTVPAAALTASSATPQVAEVTLNVGPTDIGRRFSVKLAAAGGAAVEAGGITIFGHAHGPTTFTVPLPQDLVPAGAAAGTVPVSIRVDPLPAAAGTPAAAPSANAPGVPPVQVTGIIVRTN